MEETWKDITGYEGSYQVSTLGRVRSLDRIDSENHFRKGIILKQKDLRGYKRVGLRNGKEQKEYQVHRLVALAFIPNPQNYPQVNHKDCNPENNSVDNLEWCDATYNINYGERNKKVSSKLSGKPKPWALKSVKQYSKEGNYIATYPSIIMAANENSLWAQNIIACLKGRQKTTGGFIWKYA